MAKGKKVVSKKIAQPKQTGISLSRSSVAKDITTQIKLGESYVSLILGAIVVLGLSIIFFIFVKESSFNRSTNSISNTQTPSIPSTITNPSKTYVLQDGEGLWDVAVKFYGDGYRWTDIAKANHMDEQTANNLNPGTKLIIPNSK